MPDRQSQVGAPHLRRKLCSWSPTLPEGLTCSLKEENPMKGTSSADGASMSSEEAS